jgi:hypothetical protein
MRATSRSSMSTSKPACEGRKIPCGRGCRPHHQPMIADGQVTAASRRASATLC